MRDFTQFTSFCVHLSHAASNIPDDMAKVEWITFVGCTTGTTMAIIALAEQTDGECPPFRPIFDTLFTHEDVIDFIARENGAIVTYKREDGEAAPAAHIVN